MEIDSETLEVGLEIDFDKLLASDENPSVYGLLLKVSREIAYLAWRYPHCLQPEPICEELQDRNEPFLVGFTPDHV
ncbi:hypothetical protein HO133_009295 [Letharia lupina]|uniref:Uncharacterized protein n=1 Tax=Letharia lupina TaxID=560253 RepID=A0A8H6FFZ0_9LECA|nr:uncharacterized protein HO133_009295 [Letharia lupina]KAF6226429.1 hypothetical protein HO133_009295 [Letharia lupina]